MQPSAMQPVWIAAALIGALPFAFVVAPLMGEILWRMLRR
jgi:hypothetical protein